MFKDYQEATSYWCFMYFCTPIQIKPSTMCNICINYVIYIYIYLYIFILLNTYIIYYIYVYIQIYIYIYIIYIFTYHLSRYLSIWTIYFPEYLLLEIIKRELHTIYSIIPHLLMTYSFSIIT